MLQANVLQSTTLLPENRRKHSRVVSDEQSAQFRIMKEMANKTKGDIEHTFIHTEVLDDSSLIIHGQNSDVTGKIVFSRAYTVHENWAVE